MAVFDLAIVGGGIVGLATAMEWVQAFPGTRLALLEKEPELAAHQTGRNSGVIHSGIYYRPGSLKAKTCVAGAKLMVEFCQAHRIPHQLCGKLVVAAHESELPGLRTLYERGMANGVAGLELVGPARMREIEPHAQGLQALHVRSAGVVDYRAVARAFAETIRQRGGEIRTGARVRRLARRDRVWVVETTGGEVQSTVLITCGGLHADRLSVMAGAPSDLLIVPFRGEYYDVVPGRRSLVKAMIYPVPNPVLPFLGVHFTRSVDGRVHAGPNAVLALKREGYRKTDLDVWDILQMVGFPGFWKMASRFLRVGAEEAWRSWNKRAFVQALQRLVPDVRAADLSPAASGVRAQALDADGRLADDFNIAEGDGVIHVRNVPSPAATASIQIGRTIVEMAASAFASSVAGHHSLKGTEDRAIVV